MPWAIAVALRWLLPAGVAPVGLVGVPFACEVGRFACGSGACWACWGTFSLRSWADLSRVWSVWNVWGGSGACWACWGTFCLRSWADFWRVWSVWSVVAPVGLVGVPFACEAGRFACGGCAELGGLLEGLERLERLRPVKRQPGTSIRSHCCGRGDALSHCCGLVVASACGRGACWACWGTVCLRSWAFCMRRHKAWWKLPPGSCREAPEAWTP